MELEAAATLTVMLSAVEHMAQGWTDHNPVLQLEWTQLDGLKESHGGE